MTGLVTGRSLGLLVCTRCRATVRPAGEGRWRCPRCEAPLHERRPQSLATTAALVVTAAVLYIPANVLPVMRTHTFFGDDDDTILSGVISLAQQGSWPIALLVFFASIVVPLLKLVAMGEILFAVSGGAIPGALCLAAQAVCSAWWNSSAAGRCWMCSRCRCS